MSAEIINGDCREELVKMPSESVHCIVTSPPYFGLRDYGHPDQIGKEDTLPCYVEQLCRVFREARRVLRRDGTFWLNIGDGYGKGKQLLGVPWRVAFALQEDGWILRSEVIWSKGTHKPERVSDRPTNSHEKLFLFTRAKSYFYDAEAVAIPSSSAKGRPQRMRAEEIAKNAGLTEAHFKAIRSVGITDVGKGRETQSGTGKNLPEVQALADEAKIVLRGYYREFLIGDTVNLRNVWTVDSSTFPGVHTAVFPPALIEPCIKAGCPLGGVVLDPFAGSGTTGIVAGRLGRRSVLIELNETYAEMAANRILQETANV